LPGADDQLVVIIQCESFADPAAVFSQPDEGLPGLTRARELSWQSGRLMVHGFGAYTMRTEFGVLFGISEEALGVRRFDPFLTAGSMTTWALPHRLCPGDWDTIFIHPHDMRFYGRDKLMPAAGFRTIVGEDAFGPPTVADGRYVTDAALCDKVFELAQTSDGPSLIYAVSIENHGPWAGDGGESANGNKAGYVRLLKRSDAMLQRLIEGLPKLGRPVVLCFFGDHRPSIPQVSVPGGERHTPYIIIRFGKDGHPDAPDRPPVDLTPDELHAAILGVIGSGGGQGSHQAIA
jgi:phosphoglycerol transferase MdoB-like AlkP superfamily enzyme